eukprot:evm.model.scf_224.5 EVM.evm.TU.scf_224.5   scf_224:50820-58119(+)
MSGVTRLELPVALDEVLSTREATVVQSVDADKLRLLLGWLVEQLRGQAAEVEAGRAAATGLAKDVDDLRALGEELRGGLAGLEKEQLPGIEDRLGSLEDASVDLKERADAADELGKSNRQDVDKLKDAFDTFVSNSDTAGGGGNSAALEPEGHDLTATATGSGEQNTHGREDTVGGPSGKIERTQDAGNSNSQNNEESQATTSCTLNAEDVDVMNTRLDKIEKELSQLSNESRGHHGRDFPTQKPSPGLEKRVENLERRLQRQLAQVRGTEPPSASPQLASNNPGANEQPLGALSRRDSAGNRPSAVNEDVQVDGTWGPAVANLEASYGADWQPSVSELEARIDSVQAELQDLRGIFGGDAYQTPEEFGTVEPDEPHNAVLQVHAAGSPPSDPQSFQSPDLDTHSFHANQQSGSDSLGQSPSPDGPTHGAVSNVANVSGAPAATGTTDDAAARATKSINECKNSLKNLAVMVTGLKRRMEDTVCKADHDSVRRDVDHLKESMSSTPGIGLRLADVDCVTNTSTPGYGSGVAKSMPPGPQDQGSRGASEAVSKTDGLAGAKLAAQAGPTEESDAGVDDHESATARRDAVEIVHTSQSTLRLEGIQKLMGKVEDMWRRLDRAIADIDSLKRSTNRVGSPPIRSQGSSHITTGNFARLDKCEEDPALLCNSLQPQIQRLEEATELLAILGITMAVGRSPLSDTSGGQPEQTEKYEGLQVVSYRKGCAVFWGHAVAIRATV